MKSRIILLGTGTPNPDPERFGPSILISVYDLFYLVDFGAGVVRRVASAGFDVSKINRAFLTHLHSDHTIGYPDIILTPGVMGRTEPLEVYGPKGIKNMTEHIMEAYHIDLQERFQGLEPASKEAYVVNPHEIQEGQIYKDDAVTVEAFLVDHGSLESYGFKFLLPDRTVVISGDTRPSEKLVRVAKDCDVLIHEVYSAEGLKLRSKDWREYHSSVHTSGYELSKIAQEVNPGLLVLYHQLLWKSNEDQLLKEITKYYDGRVISGKDLDEF